VTICLNCASQNSYLNLTKNDDLDFVTEISSDQDLGFKASFNALLLALMNFVIAITLW